MIEDLPVETAELRTRRDPDGTKWIRAEDVIAGLRNPAAGMVLKASRLRDEGEHFTADCLELTARALQYRADQFDVALMDWTTGT